MEESELLRLLEGARIHNERNGVTGILLYARGTFIQVLEGEESEVERIFNVISHDPRHQDVTLIEKEPIQERMFANWSMGFRFLTTELETVPGLTQFFSRGLDPQTLIHRRKEICNLLQQFREMS